VAWLFHQVVHVDGVYVLVVNHVQQAVQFVAAGVDDAQPVAGEVVGVERAYEYSDDHTQCHGQRHETVASFVGHLVGFCLLL
jgi:hypothetical protein